MRAAGTIDPWDEFWDSYFAWELEPVDDTVRIRTDLAAVSEDSAYASTHDIYELWPQLRCPVLLVRASRPMTPGGGLVVTRADAERFAAEARDATVVDVDADHYSILISTPAISAVEQFVRGHRRAQQMDPAGLRGSTFPCGRGLSVILSEPAGHSFAQPNRRRPMTSSEAPARSTARSVQDLIGIAENVTLSADPAALFRELLAAARMTLRNPAGIIAANTRRSGVMPGRFELPANARSAVTIPVPSPSPVATNGSPIRPIRRIRRTSCWLSSICCSAGLSTNSSTPPE
jgi:hypothetical protein